MPVLSLLSNLHKSGIVHYGISPDTMLIGRDGKLRISGFSIPEARFERTQIPAEVFDGYTPLEQYGYDLESGEWSDVYAFCATVYRALVGSVPQDAVSRATNDKLIIPARYAEIIPVYVINALMNGLQVDPIERTKDIETLREELSATPSNVVSSYSGIKVPSGVLRFRQRRKKTLPFMLQRMMILRDRQFLKPSLLFSAWVLLLLQVGLFTIR